MENEFGIYFGNPAEIKITNCHWIIPEHSCEENEAIFITNDDARMLCKICLRPVNRPLEEKTNE